MDPITQNPPSGDRSSPGLGLSFEFLVHLIDLSKKVSSPSSLTLNLPPSVLFRSLEEQSGLPFRFEFPLAKDQKGLDRLLSLATSVVPHPLIILEVKKEDNHLLWTFRGQGEEYRFTSPLILARPQTIRLEGHTPDAKGIFPKEALPPQEVLSSTFLGSSVLPDESVITKHGSLSPKALISPQSLGPVAVWPHYVSGKTVELTIRWVSQEEGKPLESGGIDDIVFSLDIPWKGGPNRGNKTQKVLLTGLFSRDQIVLKGRHLPKDFLDEMNRRTPLMAESLRLYPGVSLVLHLGGEPSDPEREPSR